MSDSIATTTIKTCLTCRYHKYTYWENACVNPEIAPINPIDGKPSPIKCSWARSHTHLNNLCGPEGRLWTYLTEEQAKEARAYEKQEANRNKWWYL
jgi:hypothetical protein